MNKLKIKGGNRLTGEIYISGAKNAALGIIAGVVLSDEPCLLENIPDISDMRDMFMILKDMGAVIEKKDSSSYYIDPRPINTTEVISDIARNMRGSYYFLGALLGRNKKASVSMPGGCNLGARPIDQHLKGFKALGAKWTIRDGVVTVEAEKLKGANIYLDVVSVGATMNVMLAAVKADGLTVIENAAKEPHIVDLANFLNSMGADIRGAGTDVIKIRGTKHLHAAEYSIIPDQIEAGTYMAAVAAAGGSVIIRNVIPKHLESITSKLEEAGAQIIEGDDSVKITRNEPLTRCSVKTMPHPGFPTDMQPQIAVVLSLADGISRITESIFESRFKYASELIKMGADITIKGEDVAIINGVSSLAPADLMATDLRAGAALIIAALCADGVSTIGNIHYIERGYENYIEKLRGVGAEIELITE